MTTTRTLTMKKTTHLGLLAGLMALSAAVNAQDASKTALQPDQRARIQAVGQSVLQAMRTAEPAPEREAVMEQIRAIKQQVDVMAALDISSSLSLQGQTAPQNLAAQREANVDSAMNALRSRLETLKAQTQDLRDRQQSQAPTLWQRITGLFGQAGTPADNQRALVKPLSVTALTALDTLDAEVESAMALPPQQRHEKLKVLSQRLTLSKKPTSPEASSAPGVTTGGEGFTVSSEETPTFQARTQHRRTFSLDN